MEPIKITFPISLVHPHPLGPVLSALAVLFLKLCDFHGL